MSALPMLRPVVAAANLPIHIYPGQIHVAGNDVRIRTILGSCVAVTLFDPKAGIGGMNHFLLPGQPRRKEEELRYGATATERLIDRMIAAGASPLRLVAGIFGGGAVLDVLAASMREPLGLQNVAAARRSLAERNILVLKESFGGRTGRTVTFDLGTGEIDAREIRK